MFRRLSSFMFEPQPLFVNLNILLIGVRIFAARIYQNHNADLLHQKSPRFTCHMRQWFIQNIGSSIDTFTFLIAEVVLQLQRVERLKDI